MADSALRLRTQLRRRRRHSVTSTTASRRRRRQQQSRQVPLKQSSDTLYEPCALGAEEYYVEKILGERVDPRTKQRFFRVRWQGYSPEHDTWEPESNLSGVRDFVEAYRCERRDRQQKRLLARGVEASKTTENVCRRRMGSWEYVPTSELVAKKTRFFDDLAEGKIDVRSDDLYSRVKCRRRQPGCEDENSTEAVHVLHNNEIFAEKENIEGKSHENELIKARSINIEDQESKDEVKSVIDNEEKPKVEEENEKEVALPEHGEDVNKNQNDIQNVSDNKVIEKDEKMNGDQETAKVPTLHIAENTESLDNENNKVTPTQIDNEISPNSIEVEKNDHMVGISREASSDISPPELSPISPVSPKSPCSTPMRSLSPTVVNRALEAPRPPATTASVSQNFEAAPPSTSAANFTTSNVSFLFTPTSVNQSATVPSSSYVPSPVTTIASKKSASKPMRKPRPSNTPQRRLVQKVSPSQQPSRPNQVTMASNSSVSMTNSCAMSRPSLSHHLASVSSAPLPSAPQTGLRAPGSSFSMAPTFHFPSTSTAGSAGQVLPGMSSLLHSTGPQAGLQPPPPPPPPPSRIPSPNVSSYFQSSSAPPPCLGAPSIRPEILEKMIDDCMSQNHIPDVNPLLSYMVDDAKTPPPALVSVQHDYVDTERELIDAYLQSTHTGGNFDASCGANAGAMAGQDLVNGLPHLRPLGLPCAVNAGRVSNVQLRAAVLQNNYLLVRALLSNASTHTGFGGNYDLDQRDGDGETLLARCVRHGHRHMAELLLRHGASTEMPRRSDGATPLMLAVDVGLLHMTRLLLEFGASPDHPNRVGETCLHRAIRRGHTNLVELLLRWGVDFSRLDMHQHTALKYARSYPVATAHPEIERMLVNYLQTHNNQLTMTWTKFLAAHNFEAEALLCPPTNFVAVAHCPHAVYRLQLQLPGSHFHVNGGGNACASPLEGSHVLLLIHALPDHPSFFWLSDGPCLVESVALNGTEQRRLSHQWFLSTLHPLIPGSMNEVEVRLAVDASTVAQYRHVRLAVVAMKVRRPLAVPPNTISNQVESNTAITHGVENMATVN